MTPESNLNLCYRTSGLGKELAIARRAEWRNSCLALRRRHVFPPYERKTDVSNYGQIMSRRVAERTLVPAKGARGDQITARSLCGDEEPDWLAQTIGVQLRVLRCR